MIKTKGIVLKTVKYGETSIIASIFTDLLGKQSYIIKGVRTSKKTATKASLYQIGNILELEVYNAPNKSLQFVKECKLATVYQTLNDSVIKNSIVIFMVELLGQMVTEEQQSDLFEFTESVLQLVDLLPSDKLSNIPIFYTHWVATQLGYEIQCNYSDNNRFFNVLDGRFDAIGGALPFYYNEIESNVFYHFLKIETLSEIIHTPIKMEQRQMLLQGLLQFLKIHAPNFNDLKSLSILHTILSV